MPQRKHHAPAVSRPTYSVPTYTNVHGLEPLLSINDLVLIYGKSEGTIRRDLQLGTFHPEPWDKYPYRWRRSDIQADLDTRRRLPKRPHGRYAAPKLKAAKASAANGSHSYRKRAAGDRRRKG
jgi:hypothetical protein